MKIFCLQLFALEAVAISKQCFEYLKPNRFFHSNDFNGVSAPFWSVQKSNSKKTFTTSQSNLLSILAKQAESA